MSIKLQPNLVKDYKNSQIVYLVNSDKQKIFLPNQNDIDKCQ